MYDIQARGSLCLRSSLTGFALLGSSRSVSLEIFKMMGAAHSVMYDIESKNELNKYLFIRGN
jgi:hypothetical protein